MRKLLLTMMTVCAAHGVVYGQNNAKPAIPRDEALEAKVEKTLAKMTLDEKIGQMLELNLDIIGKMTVENAKIDREKVRSVMQQYMLRSSRRWATILLTSIRERQNALGSSTR